MRRVLCLLLAACGGDKGEVDGPIEETSTDGSSDTADTGTVTVPPVTFAATCDVQEDNALRARCTVTVEPAQGVEVTFARRDGLGASRTHASPEARASHEVPLYFMEAETAYDWSVRALGDASGPAPAGAFVTGSLPDGADVRLSSTGTPSAPFVGLASPCTDGAYAVIVDTTTGRTSWYQPFAVSPYGFMEGVSFTEDRTVLTLTDGQVSETDLAGVEGISLQVGSNLPNRVHHDVFRKDGLTYVLFQETVADGDGLWMLDGFFVYDAAETLLAEWHLFDWFTPANHDGGLFPEDYSHANSIWVDDDGTALFSMRHLSAIAAVRGDPAAADFGDILWRMSNPTSEFGTDFTYTAAVSGPADFERQHNVHLLPDGRMLLFDNRTDFLEPSRAVELSFDVARGTAVFDQEFVLPEHCDFQGGAQRTPSGNTLATCAPMRRAYEFDPAGEIVWETEAVCNTGVGIYIPRFVPLDW